MLRTKQVLETFEVKIQLNFQEISGFLEHQLALPILLDVSISYFLSMPKTLADVYAVTFILWSYAKLLVCKIPWAKTPKGLFWSVTQGVLYLHIAQWRSGLPLGKVQEDLPFMCLDGSLLFRKILFLWFQIHFQVSLWKTCVENEPF